MKQKGIQCSLHYRPVHTFTSYKEFITHVPVTESIEKRIITLPLFPHIGVEQIKYVVENLKLLTRH